MKKIGILFTVLFCLLATDVRTVVPVDEVTLTGQILAYDYDDDDKIVSVLLSIAGADEDETTEYVIVMDGKGKELLKLVGKKVELKGRVRVIDEEDHIKVSSYKEIK